MTRSVPVARRSTQLVVAMCLIAGLTVIVLVALFSPSRAAVAQGIQDISTTAHTWSATLGVNSLADGPQIFCNSGSGGCP